MLVVDGYNVICGWPELAARMDHLEQVRDQLTDLLDSYAAYKDYRVVLVFDAQGAGGKLTTVQKASAFLQVVYTKEGETADSYIEKTAYQLVREGWGVYVVTSDWAEQLTILGAGAWRIPVRELRSAVLEMQKLIRKEYIARPGQGRRELEGRITGEAASRLNEMRRGSKPQE
jgi:hypothetical protein